MSRLRPFKCTDLFHFNRVNLDHFTETYSTAYYLNYLATWPDLCFVSTHASCSESASASASASGSNAAGSGGGGGDTQIMGYLFGKAEGTDGAAPGAGPKEKERHGHVTAVTVGPEFRRLGLARELMGLLEEASSLMYSVSDGPALCCCEARRVVLTIRSAPFRSSGLLHRPLRSTFECSCCGPLPKFGLCGAQGSQRVLSGWGTGRVRRGWVW